MQTMGAPYRKSTGIKGSFDAVVIGSEWVGSTSHRCSRKTAAACWTVGLHYIGDVVLAGFAVLGRDLMCDIRTPTEPVSV
jgi:hypothetical protein